MPGLVARILNGTGHINVGQGAVMGCARAWWCPEPGACRICGADNGIRNLIYHARRHFAEITDYLAGLRLDAAPRRRQVARWLPGRPVCQDPKCLGETLQNRVWEQEMWVRTPLNVSPDRNPTLNKTGAFRWLAGFIERCAAADWTPFANPPGVDRIGVFLRSKDLREPHIDYERQFDDP